MLSWVASHCSFEHSVGAATFKGLSCSLPLNYCVSMSSSSWIDLAAAAMRDAIIGAFAMSALLLGLLA